jgi:hypothetical protein
VVANDGDLGDRPYICKCVNSANLPRRRVTRTSLGNSSRGLRLVASGAKRKTVPQILDQDWLRLVRSSSRQTAGNSANLGYVPCSRYTSNWDYSIRNPEARMFRGSTFCALDILMGHHSVRCWAVSETLHVVTLLLSSLTIASFAYLHL